MSTTPSANVILKSLNKAQKRAVASKASTVAILAGPGSGKTHTLTSRVVWLIQEAGYQPADVIVATFTVKAAREMKERIGKLLGEEVEKKIILGTFHSIARRYLAKYGKHIGLDTKFTIADDGDTKAIIARICKRLDLGVDPGFAKSWISKTKARGTNGASSDKNPKSKDHPHLLTCFEAYKEHMERSNLLDYDDLLVKSVQLLKTRPECVANVQMVLIDEYQDTNPIQYHIVKMLADNHQNICVCGDDDQSIYGFRGADIRNILEFEKDYPNAKVIKLEENYRSKANILNAANEVIKNNCNRKNKVLRTSNGSGEKIKIYRAYSDVDESQFIASEIKKIIKEEDKSYKDFAILYRTNAQSRVFEEAFMRNNIPYKIIGGLKFYDRKEIKDIMAYLKLINNPLDDISLKRIINVPKRGIGDSTMDKIQEFALSMEECVYSGLLDVDSIGLSTRATSSINKFVSLINSFIRKKDEVNVSKLIDEILQSTGYMAELQKTNNIEDLTRIENLKELVSAAVDFESYSEDKSLSAFLEQVTLVSDIDNFDEEADTVALMTVHSAKGLEFPVVFMVGMENGVFPGTQSLDNDEEMEESRRLCYVGITRAKEKLYMTSAERRII